MNIEKIGVERLNPAAYNPRKELKAGDEVIVFFKQKKYTYIVREKNIVKP